MTGSNLASHHRVGISPNESTNGVRVLFTLPTAYVAGSLAVYREGERLVEGVTETSPSAGTFTLTIPPDSTEVLKCDYIKP